jgi:hypothetical protein
MDTMTIDAPAVGVRAVDTARGALRSDVSRQWMTRPADQRFLSLDDLFRFTAERREASFEETVEAGALQMIASRDNADRLSIMLPSDREVFPSHHAFGQLCSLSGCPADFMRDLPAFIAAVNMQYKLGTAPAARDLPVKLYADGEIDQLRAATGPKYGRIYDADLVAQVQRLAGNGTGDTRWKVPGVMDWSAGTYNPWVDVTKETTTLFASDRDVFLFLVDDTHPLEVGKLANGDPDLIFRGFYCWNSEVGTRSLGIATFWLRAVCQNRNLWGVEDFDELRITHSKHGPDRFIREAAPALRTYADSEPTKLLAGIGAAKAAIAARDDDDRKSVLRDLGFSQRAALAIVETCEREEGRKPESVWDFCQGITAVARTLPNQDSRIEMERTAAKLMNRAARNAV